MRINLNYPTKEISGHHQTRQRSLLLKLIREAHGHLDAKELLKRASEVDSSISSATVYRTLRLFKDMGLIDEQRFAQARCSYELSDPSQHQHLVCRSCGKVVEFSCPLSEMVDKVKREHGFQVTSAKLYLEGECGQCAAKNQHPQG